MADESLDEILSSETPAPAAAVTTEATTTTTEEPASGAVRDEHGRFAPKAAGEPAATEQTAVEQPVKVAAPPGFVPIQALDEARAKIDEQREARIRAEARAEANERARQPAAAVEPPKVPDFWEDPNAFVGHALTPIQAAMQTQKLEFSRMMAETKFGDDVVKAADTALGEMAQTNRQEAARIAQKMAQSKHPYADLVEWHKGVVAQQRIGNDPDAFVQSELDKMLADPAKKAELLARLTGQPATVAAATGDRTASITRLPPSLSKLPGGNAEPVGGDESIDDILKSGRRRAS